MTDADKEAGRGEGRAWMPLPDTVDLKACPKCGETALEGQEECFGCGGGPYNDRAWREFPRLRESDPGGEPSVRRLSDGSIPDTAHWEDYYDYAAFVEDGTLVIETAAAKEGSICCSDPDALRVIYALLRRELTDERAAPTDEAPEGGI